jgi:signal peptidase II
MFCVAGSWFDIPLLIGIAPFITIVLFFLFRALVRLRRGAHSESRGRASWVSGCILAIAVLAGDQGLKAALSYISNAAQSHPALWASHFFDFIVVRKGISLPVTPQQWEVFQIVVVLGLLTWLFMTSGKVMAAALGLLAGSAMSNLMDWTIYEKVIDVFRLHDIGVVIEFNFSDICIFIGIIILMIAQIMRLAARDSDHYQA